MAQEFTITQIKEIIRFSLESSDEKTKLPLSLMGVHGVGKTELVQQVAADMGYNLVTLHLATQDICDLIGVPRAKDVQGRDGETHTIQIWSCPDWLHNALENTKSTGKPNLFFLDEFNRGNRFVLAAMLPFLIEGKMHTHKIGPKDGVIAACNPATDKYEVSEIIDSALLNRLGHAIFKPTHSEYIAYLKAKGVDKTTIKVAENHPEYTKISDFDLGFKVEPSRRSIFNVMTKINKKGKDWISKHGSYVIEAYLGSSFRDDWLSEYKSRDESITIDMLRDFENNRTDIERILVTQIDGTSTHRTDILSKTLELIKTFIRDNKNDLSAKDVEWMIKFFSIPIVPDDASAAVFMANPDMKRMILKDAKINIMLTNFLREKKIVQDDGVVPWAALCEQQ